MNPEQRQKMLLIAAGAVVALWASDQLVITPLTKLWKERATKIVELRKSVDKGSVLVDRTRVINERWDEMRTNTLPVEISQAEGKVLQAFDQWSKVSQISITSIKPQWKRSTDDFTTLECRVDAFGSLATLTRFLYEVEKDPLALKVESVELTSKDNEGKQITLALLVSGLVLNPTQP